MAGPDAGWAVGAHGTILRWDGTTWAAQNSGTTEFLEAVWGADADHVWAVGGNGFPLTT